MSACPPTAMLTSFFSRSCARARPGNTPAAPATPAILSTSRRLIDIFSLLVMILLLFRPANPFSACGPATSFLFSGTAPFHQRPGDGARIDVFQFAAGRHAARKTRDFAPAVTQQFGQIMRR